MIDMNMDLDAAASAKADVPTEMEMRVARASCSVGGDPADCNGPDCPCWSDAIECARAAIRAMREPTRVMRDKGAAEFSGFDPEWNSPSEYIPDAWKAMIDAASPGPR